MAGDGGNAARPAGAGRGVDQSQVLRGVLHNTTCSGMKTEVLQVHGGILRSAEHAV
jgi:hypothetical protein